MKEFRYKLKGATYEKVEVDVPWYEVAWGWVRKTRAYYAYHVLRGRPLIYRMNFVGDVTLGDLHGGIIAESALRLPPEGHNKAWDDMHYNNIWEWPTLLPGR